ncbi:MAG: flagellar motor protein MotA, partial [Kiloniellales bacterium]
MTRPQRYLFRMIGFLAAVAAACAVLSPQLKDAFIANVGLNGLIVGVLFIGIFYIFRQVVTLRPEITWLEHLRRES